MRAPGAVRRAALGLSLERSHETAEAIEEQRVAAHDYRAQIVVDERAEHDRPNALLLGGAANAAHGLVSLRCVRDERQRHLTHFKARKLREHTVAHRLRRDAGLIGDEKHGAAPGAFWLCRVARHAVESFTAPHRAQAASAHA
jgi:hypothetical protein